MMYKADNPNITWMKHHLYICQRDSIHVQNHLLFRRHLRAHPEAVKAYSDLKMRLAQQHPHDIDAYINGKTPMVTAFLRAEGMSEDHIQDIMNVNE